MPTSKSSLAETLVIRPENAADPAECAAIADLVERAFHAVPESDGTEGALVAALRASGDVVADLTLVALESERIVGHVLFSRMHVGDTPALALAPLAVTPEKQRMGIGSALVHRALERARQADKAPGAPRFVIVLGVPDYYSRFGFTRAADFGIAVPEGFPPECFLALELVPGPALANARVRYAAPFGL